MGQSAGRVVPMTVAVAWMLVGSRSVEATQALDVPMSAPRVTPALEKTHVNLKITPNDNPAMAFSVAAPRGWTYSKQVGNLPLPKPLAPRPLGFIADGTKPGAPVIAIAVTTIPFEIPVDAWARMSFEHEGWKLAASHWFPGRFGLFFDVTGTRVVDGVEEVRRTSVHKDGSNVFSVNCLSARKHWDDFKEICWVAHGTFELLDATKKSEMESWRRAAAQNPASRPRTPKAGQLKR